MLSGEVKVVHTGIQVKLDVRVFLALGAVVVWAAFDAFAVVSTCFVRRVNAGLHTPARSGAEVRL